MRASRRAISASSASRAAKARPASSRAEHGAWGSISWRSSATRACRAVCTRPSSGSSSPAAIRSRVVLPAPFGPTRPTRSPAPTTRSTPPKRRRPPKPLPMDSRRSSTGGRLGGRGRHSNLGADRPKSPPWTRSGCWRRESGASICSSIPGPSRRPTPRTPGASRPWCAATPAAWSARSRGCSPSRAPRPGAPSWARLPRELQYVLVLLYFELLDGRLRRRRILH